MAEKVKRFDFQRFDTINEAPTFKSLCHEMYKSFGGAWINLQPIAHTEAERDLMKAQLHELRDKVRELMEKVREVKSDE